MSHYDDALQQFIADKRKSGKVWVPKLYQALLDDGKEPKEAYNDIRSRLSAHFKAKTIRGYVNDPRAKQKMGYALDIENAKRSALKAYGKEPEIGVLQMSEEELDKDIDKHIENINKQLEEDKKIYRPEAELALEKERDEYKDHFKELAERFNPLERERDELRDSRQQIADKFNITLLQVDQLTADMHILNNKFAAAESMLVTKNKELDQVAHQILEQQTRIGELVAENHQLKTATTTKHPDESATLKLLDAEIEELKQPYEATAKMPVQFTCPNCKEVRDVSWDVFVRCMPEYKTAEILKKETIEHHMVKKGFLVQRDMGI